MSDVKTESVINSYSYLTEQENWKGLNIEACKKSKKSKEVQIQANQEVNNDFINSSITLSEKSNLTYVDEDINNNENKENKLTLRKKTKTKSKQKPSSENKTNRQRGKYLIAMSGYSSYIYNRPLRKRKDEILKNGSSCNVVIINSQKIYIINTCAFDSLVEILTAAYCNYSLFKNYLDENPENLFLNFIKKVC